MRFTVPGLRVESKKKSFFLSCVLPFCLLATHCLVGHSSVQLEASLTCAYFRATQMQLGRGPSPSLVKNPVVCSENICCLFRAAWPAVLQPGATGLEQRSCERSSFLARLHHPHNLAASITFGRHPVQGAFLPPLTRVNNVRMVKSRGKQAMVEW